MIDARDDVDVSSLPDVAFGHRDPLWWGILLLVLIEATMFAMLAGTYLYLLHVAAHLGVALTWPPPGTALPGLGWSTLNIVVLLVSTVPMYLARGASERADVRGVRRWLAVATALGLVAIALRALEFTTAGCRWDDHAYGSIVWATLGMHAAHLVTSLIENVLLLGLFVFARVEGKHFVDVSSNGVYWYFVVGSWVPLYALIYFVPRATS